jgi:NAD(P)-dependent dehydrogenase (short-subunit alcohol dehydrogenase family)
VALKTNGVSRPTSHREAEANKVVAWQVGVKDPQEISEASLVEFDRFYQVNVRGALICTREASRIMKMQESRSVSGRNGPRDVGRGCIVNVGSATSYVPLPSIVQYTASKHALLGITRNAGTSHAIPDGGMP